MKLESPAFGSQHPIPKKHTGEGKDISPPLRFIDIPPETKSLVVIVDDPDAPMGTFDHWITWNIPPSTREFSEGGKGPVEGMNSFRSLQYRGPMPPPGKVHRYFFKLYELDSTLNLQEGATKDLVEDAMKGHIITQAELIGTYKR
jgi:Raf kinase inhibitor-like YbhB/YbcL family protein